MYPRRPARNRACRVLSFCIALAIAAPASAQLGDFGRPKPSLLEGLFAPQYWKGPVTGYSSYPFTNLEEELRDRFYSLVYPHEPRGKSNLVILEFQVAHLFPPRATTYDYTEYGRMLLWTPRRSEASQYNRLLEDMANDGRLIGPFVNVACAVADLDEKRERSLAYVGELSKAEVGDAFGRIGENRAITAWVQSSLHRRLASYRYALERLVIAVPSRQAVEAERGLKHLQQVVLDADPLLARCSGIGLVVPADGAGGRPIISK